MKMQCTEATTLGEKISLRLFLPGQGGIEVEEEPEFTLFLTDFPVGDDPESGEVIGNCFPTLFE